MAVLMVGTVVRYVRVLIGSQLLFVNASQRSGVYVVARTQSRTLVETEEFFITKYLRMRYEIQQQDISLLKVINDHSRENDGVNGHSDLYLQQHEHHVKHRVHWSVHTTTTTTSTSPLCFLIATLFSSSTVLFKSLSALYGSTRLS